MSANPEGKKEDRPGGGGAVNDLTPPGEQTLKYIPGEQQTMQQPPPSSVQQNTVMQPQGTMPQVGSSLGATPPSRPPSSMAGAKAKSTSSTDYGQDVALAVEIQDLTGERLLMAAPRVESHGYQCPALNSIPLLAKIGQGGMGAVYYGIHPRLRSEVAVKVLPFHLAEQDPGMIRRFFREAQIAAQVRSPHLCNVMDVNEEAGLFFLVMEYVTGCTAGQYLKALIEKGVQGLPEKDTLEIAIGATEGLWAAHAQGVVHRDIKPDNIMIPYMQRGSKEYDLKRAKLMDLGLARSEESNQSLTGAQSAMGTPGYMAPEQAMDAKTADKRSDVFSMGAAIYCLLTGKPPFKGETIMKVLMATMHEPHEPVIKLRPDVSPMLNEILEKSLAKKQDVRFGDAKQLLTALEDCKRLISGEGGTGILSGAKTFAFSNGGTKTGGTQQTIMHAGPTTGAQGAPAKSNKGMMYVAAGVAVVLLGGGAAMMMKSKSKDGGTVVENNDPGKKTGDGSGDTKKPPREIDDQTRLLLKKHAKFMNEALGSLEKGDIEDAKLSFDLAKSFGLSDIPEARELEAKYEGKLKGEAKKKDFDAGMKIVEGLAAKNDYMAALREINKLDPPDDASKKLAETKEKGLNELYRNQKKAADMQKLLDEAAALPKEKVNVAMDKVTEVKRAFPDATNDMNKRAIELETRLKGIIKDQGDAEKYDRLMKDEKALEDKGDPEGASKLAWEAKTVLPERPEARDALKRLQSKLDEKATDALKKQAEREFTEYMTQANDYATKEDYEKADEYLRKALGINAKDELALNLRTRIDYGVLAKKQRAELNRKTEEFNAQIKTARLSLEDGNLKDVADMMKAVDPQFKDHPDLARLRSDLVKKAEAMKARDEYSATLDKLREYIRNGDADNALATYALAEKSPAVDSALKKLKDKVDEVVEEKKKMKDSEAQYTSLVISGTNFEKAGDEKSEPSDKLASYELALPKYVQAKGIKKGGDADTKEAALRKKIDTARAAEQKALQAAAEAKRKKDEQDALERLNRKQFDERIAGFDLAFKSNDFATARSNLDEAAKLINNDPRLKEKEADLKKAQADSDKKAGAALELAAMKAPKGEYDDAIKDVNAAAQQYPRRDLNSAIQALSALKRVESSAQQELVSSAAKLKQLDARAGPKGANERARVAAAQRNLQTLTTSAAETLARVRFQDSGVAVQKLDGDFDMRKRELNSALNQYEDAINVKEPPPHTDTGDQNPFKTENKKPPVRQPDPPKKTNGGNSGKNAGDVNPFE